MADQTTDSVTSVSQRTVMSVVLRTATTVPKAWYALTQEPTRAPTMMWRSASQATSVWVGATIAVVMRVTPLGLPRSVSLAPAGLLTLLFYTIAVPESIPNVVESVRMP